MTYKKFIYYNLTLPKLIALGSDVAIGIWLEIGVLGLVGVGHRQGETLGSGSGNTRTWSHVGVAELI